MPKFNCIFFSLFEALISALLLIHKSFVHDQTFQEQNEIKDTKVFNFLIKYSLYFTCCTLCHLIKKNRLAFSDRCLSQTAFCDTRQFGQNVNLFFSHTDRIEGTKIDIWQDHRNKGNFTLFELFFEIYTIIKCPKVYNKYQKSKLIPLINRAICIVVMSWRDKINLCSTTSEQF